MIEKSEKGSGVCRMNWHGTLRLIFVVCLAIPLGLPLGNCGICTDVPSRDIPIWELAITSPTRYYAGQSVAETPEGDLFVAGYAYDYEGNDTLLVLRRTGDGSPRWLKEHTLGSSPVQGTRIVLESDGGALVFGVAGAFDRPDYYLLRIDANGSKLWDKRFGGSRLDQAVDVLRLEDGYLLLGTTESTGSGGYDMELLRIDSAGEQIWSRNYGGAADDMAVRMIATADGGYALLGSTSSLGVGELDMYLVKVDAEGEEQWYKTFGYSNYNYGGALLQTEDGGYLLAGNTGGAYLVQTDADGELVWERVLGEDGYYDVRDMAPRPAGGYVLTGPGKVDGNYFEVCAAAFLMEVTTEGQLVQTRLFGEYNETESSQMLPSRDGRMILVGATTGYTNDYADFRSAVYLAKVGTRSF